ncbi:TniB family NTP-binding protein [Rhodobacter sp. CZR27]|uniref:TniB family NTP-binding protein n=1 Tax=Rhodobacter sp. CZR27 TaxID=2033869 RepID=UPI000BBE3766|nr:TniB family NTP-binding protein [Rhodobacter sp. CZR27]
MTDMTLPLETPAAEEIEATLAASTRPPRDNVPALCHWIRNRYVSSDWDNDLLARLEMVLCRDGDGRVQAQPKSFHGETRGIAVTGPSRDGKSTLVRRVLERELGERIDDKRVGRHVVYQRVRTAATLKSVYRDLCAATGFTRLPARMTIPEAQELAMHRLRLADIRIVILDEVHNLLGYDNRAVNLFLKTFMQDGGEFCLIAIGTEVLRKFIYEREENLELAGRLLELSLKRFPQKTSLALINSALDGLSAEAGLRLAPSIRRDPYFAERILEGCRGSYGRSMRLISTSIVLALEEGASALDIEDFRRVFDLDLLYLNPENPFLLSDWAARATAAVGDAVGLIDSDFGAASKTRRRRKAGKGIPT